MVSTPIGSTNSPDISEKLPPSTTPVSQLEPANAFISNPTTIMQPTLQPGLPYMSNLFPSQTSHSFPILYSGPFPTSTTTTTEVQPVSLYSEYLGNPYNTPPVPKANVEMGNVTESDTQNQSELNLSNSDINKNNSSSTSVIDNNNSTIFFQSSNYFNNTPNSNFSPSGSDLLFGVNIQKSNTNIFVDDNDSASKSTNGV